jgi:hypothetical protein
MKRITYAILGALLVGAVVYAGTLTTSLTQRQVRDPRQLETILEDNFTELDSRTDAATALSVTNAQPVTVAAGVYVVSGTGQANNATNTITLVAPTAAGQSVTFIAATATSNLIAIADSGTVAASGTIELDGNDTAVLRAVDTSTWCLISESDN